MVEVMFNCPKTGHRVATGIPKDLLDKCKTSKHQCHPDCPEGEHHGSTLEFYIGDSSEKE